MTNPRPGKVLKAKPSPEQIQAAQTLEWELTSSASKFLGTYYRPKFWLYVAHLIRREVPA